MGKYLYLIEERQKKDRASIAKLRENLLEDIKEVLSELSKIVSFKDAYIFGSITDSKTFSGNSDIDIAFYGLREKDFFKAMAFLSRYLQRDVDIIQLEGHILEKEIKNKGIKWKG